MNYFPEELNIAKSCNLTAVSFSLLSEDNELTHSSSSCKEYVLDAVTATLNHTTYNRFSRANLNEIRIWTQNIGNVQKSLDLINKVESIIDFRKTKAYHVKNCLSATIFCGDKSWFLAPPLTSMYTLLIRIGARYHDIVNSLEESFDKLQEIHTYDNSIFANARKGIEKILTFGPYYLFGDNIKNNWDTAVHGDGIESYSTGRLSEKFPQWQ